MKIGILNYADVRNFGDVLFPIIVKQELCSRLADCDIEYITPTGSNWGGMYSKRFDSVDLQSYDALIMGGGEVVHRLDGMLSGIYERFGLKGIEKPTDVVLGFSDVIGPYKAWLALGVPEPDEAAKADILSAMQGLHYIGVRGARSAARLRNISPSAEIHQTPDLGWLFPRICHPRNVSTFTNGRPYIAVQALAIQDVARLVFDLRKISEHYGLDVVLVPLTRCWNDIAILKSVYDASDGEFILVDDWMSDLDKLAILGGSTIYVGQSMHGFIGAMSQMRVAGICLPDGDDKFGELLRGLGLPHFRYPDWSGVESLVGTVTGSSLRPVLEKVTAYQRELDETFDTLCASIKLEHTRKLGGVV